jgi:N-acyl-L-homoserine lactone synthetase
MHRSSTARRLPYASDSDEQIKATLLNNPANKESEIFARGDAIAAHLLKWLAPLRFAEARDEEDRKAAYRLRYQAVLEEGMADPANFPAGMESDVYDADAIQIIGWDEIGPIASCRLVFPAPGRRLPLEDVFGPIGAGSDRMVEWGRVTVDSRLRGTGGRIFMGLAARGWIAMRARGLTTAIGVTPERLVQLFRALGFPLAVIGSPRTHWGDERVPILCDGPQAVQALERLWLAKDEELSP